MTQRIIIDADFTDLEEMLIHLQECPQPMRVVHDGVEYGVYQEFGTTTIAPRPALQTAVSEVEPAYRALMSQITTVERPDAAIAKLAHDLEAQWKAQIVAMRIIDTGAYLNSIRVSRPTRLVNDEDWEVV